jgi:hypothetical protein
MKCDTYPDWAQKGRALPAYADGENLHLGVMVFNLLVANSEYLYGQIF